MLRVSILGVAALYLMACTSDGSDERDYRPEVGQVRAAIGNQDKNDFRERKTENKLMTKRKADCDNDPRVVLGLVSSDICVGADLFFREPFGGNGRACGSCHAAQFDFTISPEFIASLEPDDPLFVAENDPNLTQLEKPELMRDFGLILENVDGAEDPTNKFVMRSVPHCFSLKTSITPAPIVNPDGTGVDGTTQPPIERTGWGGDGAPAPGGLKQFQAGAIFQHYTKSLARVAGTDFIEATDEQLTDIEKFLLSIGRTEDIDLDSYTLSDPAAETGRTTFRDSRCNGCHHNAGAQTNPGPQNNPVFNGNFDTGIEAVRITDLDDMSIPHDGGFGGAAPGDPFNHDADGDGLLDSYGKGTFSTTPLFEAADTGPFFHTNAFTTIEDAIRFYTEPAFANSAAGGGNAIPFGDTDIENVGKFLRVLNASFNCKLAIARLQAETKINTNYKNQWKGLQYGLLDAAQAEIRDALADLSQVGINAGAVTQLTTADQEITTAFANSSHGQRLAHAQAALAAVLAADASLGTGLDFTVGPGSIMF